MSNRLTLLECDAICAALAFLLAGETDGFDPVLVEAAERAHDKLWARLEAAERRNASAGKAEASKKGGAQ